MTFLLMLLAILSVTPVGVKAEETNTSQEETNTSQEETNASQDTGTKDTKKLSKGDVFTVDNNFALIESYNIGTCKFEITKNASNGNGEVKLIGVSDELRKKAYTISILKSTVSHQGVKYKITAVGKKAFANCKARRIYVNLKYLEKIEDSAFANCKNAYDFTIGKKNLKEIGSKAFAGCKRAENIQIYMAKKLKTIGSKAFYGCKKLKRISMYSSPNVKKIGKNAFKGIGKKCRISVSNAKIKKLCRKKGIPKTVTVVC